MGYETSMFVDQPLDEDFLCLICASVQEKPTIACENGHTMCLDCIKDWEEQQSANSSSSSDDDAAIIIKCPAGCGSELSTNKTLNRPLQNFIAKLQVQCPNNTAKNTTKDDEDEDNGDAENAKKRQKCCHSPIVSCSWQGTLGEYVDKHSAGECVFATVACPDCKDSSILACDLQNHRETVCRMYNIPCEHCGDKIRRYLLQQHVKMDCLETETQCDACGEKMPRKFLGTVVDWNAVSDEKRFSEGHVRTCPKTKIPCPYYRIGCCEYLVRQDMDKHLTQNARKHADMVTGELKNIRSSKCWTASCMNWWIPLRNLLRMHNSREKYSPESHRVKVGDYKVFLKLQLQADSDNISLRICVENCPRHLLKPRIDRIYVRASRFPDDDDNYTKTDEQEMKKENDAESFLSVTAPLEKKVYNDDTDESVCRPLSLADLVENSVDVEARDLSLIFVAFRMASPEQIQLMGCAK